jgi:hypothetical protein
MDLALHRRKLFSHPKLRIRWPRLHLDLERIARANQVQKDLERRKHLAWRRMVTDPVVSLYIL